MAHDPVWADRRMLSDSAMGTASESLTTRAHPAGYDRRVSRSLESEAGALLAMLEEGVTRSSDAWAISLLARAVRDLLERVERLESEH